MVEGFENDADADSFVHAIARDWRTAKLNDVDVALCSFAEKLSQTPNQMSKQDIDHLREKGLNDRAIHDATQIISYFNYINRIADALGVEPETFIQYWGEQ